MSVRDAKRVVGACLPRGQRLTRRSFWHCAALCSVPTVPVGMGLVAASVMLCTNGKTVMEFSETGAQYLLECIRMDQQTHAARALDAVTHSELFLQTKEAVTCPESGSVVCQLCAWVLPAVGPPPLLSLTFSVPICSCENAPE